jgi:anti-sigma factor (TIGR02949 family)
VNYDLTCSTLHGYFDRELSAARAAEFKRHLEHCSDCVAELDACYFVRDSLQRSHIYEHAPASLRQKIRADLLSFAPTTASSQPLWRYWLAAATALLFVLILLGRVGHGLRGDDYQAELAGEIVDAHVRSLQLGPLTGIASNDGGVVKGWLDAKLKFAIPVRNFANEGFALKGGRLDVMEGRSVAVLVYERNGHPISVFIWRTREPDTTPRAGSRKGFQWVDWRKGKIEFCAVSDADLVDLEKLHQLISSSA